jgi:hypothetical protein
MKKIKVEFIGGLGNQLFQYAAAKKLENKFLNYKPIYHGQDANWSNQSVNIDFYLKIIIKKFSLNRYTREYQRLKDFLFGHVLDDISVNKYNFEIIPKKKIFVPFPQ